MSTDPKTVLADLAKYIDEWTALEREYYGIASWRWVKQQRNLNKRHNLTKVFVHRMKKKGVL